MAAYVVFLRERMKDMNEFQTYMEAVPPTLAGHPVKPIALYGALQTLEGEPFEGVVIAEFPDRAAALAWYNSAEYQAARQHRLKAGDYRVFVTEGL